MKKYIRSDLACEAGCDLANIRGTKYCKNETELFTIESLSILTDDAAATLGHSKGKYVTISTEKLWTLSDGLLEIISDTLSVVLKKMICKLCTKEHITSELSVLIVGLGNRAITADALGPLTADLITVTNHLKGIEDKLFKDVGMCRVSAITPGVLGKTGMESVDVIRSAVGSVAPVVFIVVDALAAGSVDRLATTIQISDTGISPGAGIGNVRSEISKKTLGVSVIALGIPTVVDSSTLIFDALSRSNVTEADTKTLSFLKNERSFYVTPKETDLITERSAKLLSSALNKALVI